MGKKEKNINLFLVLFFSFMIVLTYIFFHTENLRIGYEIEKLRKEKDKLKEEIEILQMENARLKNLKRVEKMARDLGMREMEKEQIVILRISEKKDSNESFKKGKEVASKNINFLEEKGYRK